MNIRTQSPYNMPMAAAPGYKIGANVRNQDQFSSGMPGMPAMQQNPMPNAAVMPGMEPPNPQAAGDNNSEPLNAAQLARVPQNEQKQLIGEKLYPIVKDLCSEDDAG